MACAVATRSLGFASLREPARAPPAQRKSTSAIDAAAEAASLWPKSLNERPSWRGSPQSRDEASLPKIKIFLWELAWDKAHVPDHILCRPLTLDGVGASM